MKVIFLTNQASYYQMDFARAMTKELGADNFRIAFEKGTSASRTEMGWKDEYDESYILRPSNSENEKSECLDWIDSADVVIQGRFPIRYVRKRIKQGKLTFACQERLWKKTPNWRRLLSRSVHLYKNYYSVNKPNYHFLAIGQHAASDLNSLGFFKGRSWKYGYFIDCPDYKEKTESDQLRLLWCGRFCDFKQPQKAIEILKKLKLKGVNCQLTMLGDGELRNSVEKQVFDNDLQDSVTFTGWQDQQQIFDYMSQSDLFLMTSHIGEGWGVVVNEALSHGCTVMANEELGSASVLIKNKQTGILYNDQSLADEVSNLANLDAKKIGEMGVLAYKNMQSDWSAAVAAQRTIALSQALLNGDTEQAKSLFDSGVCSLIKTT